MLMLIAIFTFTYAPAPGASRVLCVYLANHAKLCRRLAVAGSDDVTWRASPPAGFVKHLDWPPACTCDTRGLQASLPFAQIIPLLPLPLSA